MMSISVFGLLLAIPFLLTRESDCNGDSPFKNCSRSDLSALNDFKNGLEDPGNRLSSWQWSKCCQWHGISCDNRTVAVISIDLHNPYPVNPVYHSSLSRYGFWNLSGEISPSLLKLKSLQYLDLSLNTFKDIPIPEFLGSLQSLRYLNLSKAGFSGEVPPSLGNLSSLQFLDVSSEYSLMASNLDWVTSLVSLKHVVMDGVDLSVIGSNWVRVYNVLPHLTGLHLSGCALSGSISFLSPINFTSLSVLDLFFNNINSLFPNWLSNISSLTYVDLSMAGFYGRIPLSLSELPNLQYLSLGSNNLSASCSQLFRGSWQKIEVLDFSFNNIRGKLPASIGNMSSLINFNLFDNSVDRGIPSSIGKLCYLENFDLSINKLTGSLPEVLEETHWGLNSPLPSLMYLSLSNNHLVGNLPEWLSQLNNLVGLSLDYNLFHGPIPASLGNLQNLTGVNLSGNQLNGTLPDSFGQLSQLSALDVSLYNLIGSISEVHFSKLNKLKFLGLSSNSFFSNVSSNWVPPFQVQDLEVGSCHLGPTFPAWLRTQKEVTSLDISNASISDSIPNWFWDISSNLSLLNVSFNQLHGQLKNPLTVVPFADVDLSSNFLEGPTPLSTFEIELLELSNNRFSGPIPEKLAQSMPNLVFLSLSGNQLTGDIPVSIGAMVSLVVLDLSGNSLSGSIPSSIGNCSFLNAMDLSFNKLSGEIPLSFSRLNQLRSLHLSNNKFGEIPSTLSNLSSLQVLDLAKNNLAGSIPVTFGDFKAMSLEQYINEYLPYGKYRGVYYEESLIVNIKGGAQKYTKTLSLVTSIDLASNNLHGEFPKEITKLVGLVALNLSKNQVIGQIPGSISNLRQISSLDLSHNRLSGAIPSSMSTLSFLGYLNLSDNNFSGMIPYMGHVTTFDASSFDGNSGLRGAPLVLKCPGNDSDGGGGSIVEDSSDGFSDMWFYLSIGLGFAVGILVPFLIFSIRKPWSHAYFLLVDKTVDRLLYLACKTATRFRNRCNFQA
ncbi:receptor-like protein EIX2 [Hevea brasiliensis]|uniref:receptor-like protein EIX2 n=1 Tax=Hevea brasiliensis TaxID=3981 RepID=UPI0025E53F14|nr:receptor-like protein EIX2 [Hevea brasiliensis]